MGTSSIFDISTMFSIFLSVFCGYVVILKTFSCYCASQYFLCHIFCAKLPQAYWMEALIGLDLRHFMKKSFFV